MDRWTSEDYIMRVCLIVAVVCAGLVANVVFGGEDDGMQSVLVRNNAAVVTEKPVVVAESAPCAGQCCTSECRERLYSTETQCSESCRNRLFGGKVVKKSQRTVYKPVRR